MNRLAIVALGFCILCACGAWHETFPEDTGVKMVTPSQPQTPTYIEIELQSVQIDTFRTRMNRHRTGGCIIAAPPVCLDFKVNMPEGHVFSATLPQISITDTDGQVLYPLTPNGGLLINPPPMFDNENGVIRIQCGHSAGVTVHVNGVAEIEYSSTTAVRNSNHWYITKPNPIGPRQKASIPFSFKLNLLNGEQTAYRFPLPNAPNDSNRQSAR